LSSEQLSQLDSGAKLVEERGLALSRRDCFL